MKKMAEFWPGLGLDTVSNAALKNNLPGPDLGGWPRASGLPPKGASHQTL